MSQCGLAVRHWQAFSPPALIFCVGAVVVAVAAATAALRGGFIRLPPLSLPGALFPDALLLLPATAAKVFRITAGQ